MTHQEIIELMAMAMGDDTNRGNGGWSGTNDKDIYRSNAREILVRLKSSGLAIVPINPTLEMFEAYHGALKARVEVVPIAERKWKRRITTGGVWSGYRIPPKEKFFWRWEAILKATEEQEGRD